jgi:hypothetical protein
VVAKIVNGSIGGEMLGPHPQHSRTFPPSRICETEGCSTVLSIYNAGSRCSIHRAWTAASDLSLHDQHSRVVHGAEDDLQTGFHPWATRVLGAS